MGKTSKKSWVGLLMVLALAPAVSRAALEDLGPVNPVTGYPRWYRDTHGTALQLCLNNLESPAGGPGAYMCLAPPTDEGFPGSRGDENFYFMAAAAIDDGAGLVGMWEAAVEATYAAFPFVASDAITFTRIRIRIDTPVPGTYTVTHPYGVDTFSDVPAGKRAINSTLDIGVAAGTFDLTLAGSVGPFLEWDSDTAGLTMLDPRDPSGKPVVFVGDPSVPHTVKGSPFGHNFVRVEGPGGLVWETPLFTVMGQRYTDVIPQPLKVTRSTYGKFRGADGRDMTRLDVAATAKPGSQLLLSGRGLPTVLLAADARGHYASHLELAADRPLPTQLTVTNLSDVEPFSRKAPVTDDVSIASATFDARWRTLRVTVETSDQVTLPEVSVLELADPTVWTRVDKQVDSDRPWVTTYVARLADGPFVAPLRVTAQSERGGVESAAVDFPGAGTPEWVGGLELADLSVHADESPERIALLDESGLPLLTPGRTVVFLVPPANGTAQLNAGSIDYVPAIGYRGPDAFEFVILDAATGEYSSAATVTLDVVSPNRAPVAIADSTSTTAGVARTFSVVANDFDFDGTVVAASVRIVRAPAHGTATVNPDGSVTYLPAAGFPAPGAASASDAFTYTVQDDSGAVAAEATVTVRVESAPETLTFTRTEAVRSGNRWRIEGTSSVPLATHQVHAYRGTTVGAATFIGSSPIDALGAFAIDARGTQPVPSTGNTVTVTVVSDGGARVVVQARIR